MQHCAKLITNQRLWKLGRRLWALKSSRIIRSILFWRNINLKFDFLLFISFKIISLKIMIMVLTELFSLWSLANSLIAFYMIQWVFIFLILIVFTQITLWLHICTQSSFIVWIRSALSSDDRAQNIFASIIGNVLFMLIFYAHLSSLIFSLFFRCMLRDFTLAFHFLIFAF